MNKLTIDQKMFVFSLFQQHFSIYRVWDQLKKIGINLSRSTIGRLKHWTPEFEIGKRIKKNNKLKTGRPFKLKLRQINFLKKKLLSDDPPTYTSLARKFNVSKSTITNYVKRLGLVKNKCRPVHLLTEKQCMVREYRGKNMYRILCPKNLKKIITTDESLFHLSDTFKNNRFYYKEKNKKTSKKFTIRKPSFCKSVMVWGGISMKGRTKLRFVKPGVKINSKYYVEDIIKPFLKEDVPRLYKNKKFILHQDNAPSHASKFTQNFLTEQNIKFIKPQTWTPMSPDLAPMDYFVWGYLKKKIQGKNCKTILGLKKTLINAWNQIDQNHINNCLKSWRKRFSLLVNNHGKYIENYM